MNELVSVVQSEAAALAHNHALLGDFSKEESGTVPIGTPLKPISTMDQEFATQLSPKNPNHSKEFSPTSTSTPKASSPSKSSKSQKNPAFSTNSSSNFSSYLNSVLSGREAAAHLNLLSQSNPNSTTDSGKLTPLDSQQPLTTSLTTPGPTTSSSTPSNSVVLPLSTPTTTSMPSSEEPESPTSDQTLPNTQSTSSTQVVVYPQSNEKEKYVDITEYLSLPQTEAARRLNIPTSTLSKRWKEAVVNRKWPYRTICKLDKEIMTLLHNIPHGPDAPPLPPEIEGPLGLLLKKRQEELRTVIIRL